MKRVCQMILIMVVGVMLWPMVAHGAPPAPQGALAYSNDFNTPAETAPLETTKTADYETGTHAPGVFHLKLLKNQTTHWSLLPNLSYGQFSLAVELWDNSDDYVGDVSAGMVFRAQDATHLYAVLIDPRGKQGQYAIRKLDGADNWSDLVAWKPSALIQQKALHNELRVDADGAKFTVYLNGELLDSASDSAYARGGVGMIASNIDANAPHMHFDNLRIYTTEPAGTVGSNTSGGTTALPPTGRPNPVPALGLGLIALGLIHIGMWLRRRSLVPVQVGR
jgi:hypothetical protein